MATIFAAERTDKAITMYITAEAGETVFELEVNRDPSFFMDESMVYVGQAAGNVVVKDLQPDTPYYFRARKTNGGNGTWSAVFVMSTQPSAAVQPAYTGFTHEPALLVVPEPIIDLAATSLEAGSLAQNLLNDDPLSVMRISNFNTVLTFRTAGRLIDTFALLGTSANEDVAWRIRGGATAETITGAPLVDTGTLNFRTGNQIGRRPFFHGFHRLAAPTSVYFWRIDVSGFFNFFHARHLVVGLARQSVNISRGAGFGPADQGQMERTLLGGPDRVLGWRGRQVDFPISWIREAEFEAKWSDLERLVGTTEPVLALPNPKKNQYLNDRIAYGTIADMRAEIMRGDKWQRTLQINSLY